MSEERRIRVGAQELAVALDGPAQGEPLLLIMGLGLQLTSWPIELVQQLAAAGFRVIRYDHRDIGLSSSCDHLGRPRLAQAFWRHAFHLPLQPPYTLAELADDAAGLIAALGLEAAQVAGISMGGMVAQHLARRHPQRVRGLNLWMTSPGGRLLPPPRADVLRLLLSRPDRAGYQAYGERFFQAIGSPAYPSDPAELRARVAHNLARSFRPQATARQLIAIAADGDRRPWLRQLQRPVQVLHGLADPLLPIAHGRALAKALPQAQLTEIPGWGHDLPAALHPMLVEAVQRAAA
ncbi:alpha/beta fold hydrolase [Inhella proteolytica]|uniref:alpha/beta fold hydrolase n=1 Tax=Inhella proteolytica TaxID=2795029 RepID=UPI002872E9BD|nr:alpha/beta hydrolase [Inhella proteolytica]